MFQFTPNQVDRSGELIAAGMLHAGRSINEMGQSIADAITKHKDEAAKSKAKAEELQGYKTVLKGMSVDPTSGIDPEQIDKMDVGTAKGSVMAAEWRRKAYQQKQQEEGNTALNSAILGAGRLMQPRPGMVIPGGLAEPRPGQPAPTGGLFNSLMVGTTPQTDGGTLPGLSMRDALLKSAGQYPGINKSPEASSRLQAALLGALGKDAAGQNTNDQPIQFQDVPGFPSMKGWRHGNSAGIITNPEQKQEMTDYQKSLLQVRLRQSRAEAARTVAAYQQASKAADGGGISPDMLTAAQDNLNAIDDEMKLHGFNGGGGGGGGAPQTDITQEQYNSLKPGQTYWWGGKQLTKK